MSRYSDHTPTSHKQAYPPYPPPPHAAPAWYGPPPAVPASLTYDAPNQTPSPSPPSPSRAAKGNVGRDYLRSLGTSMQGLSLGTGGSENDRGCWRDERLGQPGPKQHSAERRIGPTFDRHSGLYGGNLATYALAYRTPPRPASSYQTSSTSTEKPLPRLPPPPPLPARPYSDPPPINTPSQRHAHSTPPSSTLIPASAKTTSSAGPKTFRPSPYLHLPTSPPRPVSDSVLPTLSHPPVDPHTPRRLAHKSSATVPGRTPQPRVEPIVIDLTLSPSTPDSSPVAAHITPRSPARVRRRAASDQPPRQPRPALVDASSSASSSANASSSSTGASRAQEQRKQGTPRRKGSPARVATASSAVDARMRADAVQCAGYTRTGERCKRLVKAAAPYIAYAVEDDSTRANAGIDGRDVSGSAYKDNEVGRYCKDHAGMICQVEGFYSRDKPGLWVAFEDWIPPELGQQTQTLLRTTMESRLTAKESPGFIYAYELRELQTPTTSFFKVGRTDNVPRRLGEWTNQCQSRTPTMRDIFPLSPSRQSLLASPSSPSSALHRAPTLTRSLLPGAMSAGTIQSASAAAVGGVMSLPASNSGPASTHANPGAKRWERLVHLELAELAARDRAIEWEGVRAKCADCGRGHREVFALPRSGAGMGGGGAGGGGGGEDGYAVLVEVVCRWERFVRMICE